MYFELLNRTENQISFDKRLVEITGSVYSAMILQHAIYLNSVVKKKGRSEFYKFISPCQNKLYKEGDSRIESLPISEKIFDTYIKHIGYKLGKTKNILSKSQAPIIYYKNGDGVTYYKIQEDILESILSQYLKHQWCPTKKDTICPLLSYNNINNNIYEDEEIAEANESNDSYSDLENTCSSGITIEESKDNDASVQDNCKSESIGMDDDKINPKITSAKKDKQVDVPQKQNYEYINDYKSLCKEYGILYSKGTGNMAENIVMNSFIRSGKMTSEIGEHARAVGCGDDITCFFKKVFSLANVYHINKLGSLSGFRYNYLTILNSKQKNDIQRCKYKKINEFAKMLYEKDWDVTRATETFLLPYIKVKEMTNTISEDGREWNYSFNNCDIVMKDSTSGEEEIAMSDEYLKMRLYQKINGNLLKLQLAG